MAKQPNVIHSDPDILGGTPVFVGTRVPVKTLYDYLETGDSLGEFLEDFPSVTRKQAVAALELAREMTALLIEEDTLFWSRVSQAALDTIWDNTGDDVYAELLKE